MGKAISVGLIGFGLAGRVFHAPLVAATEGLALSAVATSRADEVAAAYPGAQVRDAEGVLADPTIDLVVIATPNDSHAALAGAALEAGKAVVIDKPFATRAADAAALVALAEDRGLLLSVFHNRRWDDDFLTARALIESGALGEVATFESRFDRFRPTVQARWRESDIEGGGLLWDLGPHLIDQALVLFGPPRVITADLAIQRRGGLACDWFSLLLDYGRLKVTLSAGSLVADPAPRLAVQGTGGAFTVHGLDGQEARLREGLPPVGEPRVGRRTIGEGDRLVAEPVTLQPGAWPRYYAGVRDALRGERPPPVSAAEALAVIRAIELAEESARQGRRLTWV